MIASYVSDQLNFEAVGRKNIFLAPNQPPSETHYLIFSYLFDFSIIQDMVYAIMLTLAFLGSITCC